MRLTTGEQLREINQALKQDQRNYLHEVEQGKARIAELEAELAALKEIPEQAEIAGYKSSDGSLMSAESGALFSAKYIEQYEPLITVTHHNAIVSSLKAKAAVPDGYVLLPNEPTQEILESMTEVINARYNPNNAIHMYQALHTYKAMIAAAPAHPQNKEEPTHDA